MEKHWSTQLEAPGANRVVLKTGGLTGRFYKVSHAPYWYVDRLHRKRTQSLTSEESNTEGLISRESWLEIELLNTKKGEGRENTPYWKSLDRSYKYDAANDAENLFDKIWNLFIIFKNH